VRPVTGTIERIGDTTHIEFQGRPQWDYDLTRLPDGKIQMLLPKLDTPTEVRLKTLADDLIKSVHIDPNGPDHKVQITFELKDPKVESFDYLTDEPSRLIVDFYRQTAATAPKSEKSAKSQRLPPKKKGKAVATAQQQDYKKMGRKPAGDEFLEVTAVPATGPQTNDEDEPFSPLQAGAYDGNDPKFERFSIASQQIRDDAIIASRENIYIQFPMLKMQANRLSELEENPPEYTVNLKGTRESQEAKLILTLYENHHLGLLMKAGKYFLKAHPDSIYDEIVRNVLAEAHLALYHQNGLAADLEEARKQYSHLIQKYPTSPLTERNEILLCFLNLDQKDGLQTIQSFSKFIEKYPQSRWLDSAKKGLADGYITMHKYSDALDTYGNIEKTSLEKNEAIEAAFRRGDVYFSDKDFKRSEETYSAAIKAHAGFEKVFPNAFFNLAESQFWLGKYKESLDNYLAFLRNFPTHPHGGYAMTRVGEVLEILGADQRKVMGAFLESTFRYHQNPGAEVAYVRMTSQRMKSMKEKELRKSTEEMDRIATTSTLPNMNEFVTIMKADGYRRRGDYETAMAGLIHYYQANPMLANFEVFRQRILANIASLLRHSAEQGDFLATLKTDGAYSKTWLHNSDRLDVAFYNGWAYEQAGVFSEAEKVYTALLKRLQKIHGTDEEKERRVFEVLPSQDTLRLRLANVKAATRDLAQAQAYLVQIESVDKLSDREKIERIQLMADVAQGRHDMALAESSLMKLASEWRGQPELVIPIWQRLGDVRADRKNFVGAMQAFDMVAAAKDKALPVSDDIWAKNLRARADTLLAQGKDLAASELYQQLLDQFEQSRPLGSVRYQLGDIFFKRGDLKTANKIWSGLEGDRNAIYRQMSQEKLSQAQWQDDYKKYIQRIPAMSKAE
jgi:tetratricopeptide (TPR) repeat protein